VLLRDITYAESNGRRNAATLVTPKSPANGAGVLFLHWYGPPEPTSNRTQFIPDAVQLAQSGAVSLLIDTPWSDPDYMKDRKRTEDFTRSVALVKELRRAVDVLTAQPGVSASPVALVGHDFGAMYGTLMASADARIGAFVFMAGTRSFSDWFLFGPPRLEGAARQTFIDELAPLDPIRYVAKLTVPVLFQFASNDEYVSKATADALVAATPGKPEAVTYETGHELNDEATRDRIAWLKKRLQLK
jgi:pimeloyl-ACP methyl ester carboxylesterase